MIGTYRRISAKPEDWFAPDEVKKAKDYQRPLNVARAVSLSLLLAFLVAVIFTHAAAHLANAASESWPVRLLVVVAALTFAVEIVDLPISIWTTFKHEKEWGFSTETPSGFVSDQLKSIVLALVLQVPVFLAIWWLIRTTDLWWIYGWAVFFGFSGLLGLLYPVLIAPIFNKCTPLEDAELRARLHELTRSQGMKIRGVQVMDASKRTRKDNAYFAGAGAAKRIVIFDNLLSQPGRIIASVVAHEIGHWKRRHILKSIALAAVTTFAMFAVLRAVLSADMVLGWAGVGSLGDPAALPLFFAVFSVVFPVFGVVSAWVSRAFERQADLDALEITDDYESFVEVERGLSTRNLIDLAPAWWRYIRLSHPPPAERLELGKLWKEAKARAT